MTKLEVGKFKENGEDCILTIGEIKNDIVHYSFSWVNETVLGRGMTTSVDSMTRHIQQYTKVVQLIEFSIWH